MEGTWPAVQPRATTTQIRTHPAPRSTAPSGRSTWPRRTRPPRRPPPAAAAGLGRTARGWRGTRSAAPSHALPAAEPRVAVGGQLDGDPAMGRNLRRLAPALAEDRPPATIARGFGKADRGSRRRIGEVVE